MLEKISRWLENAGKLSKEEIKRHAVPEVELVYHRGQWWRSDMVAPEWTNLGLGRVPETRWQWFVYHLCMGLLARYPTHKVLLFSIRAAIRGDVVVDVTEEELELIEEELGLLHEGSGSTARVSVDWSQ